MRNESIKCMVGAMLIAVMLLFTGYAAAADEVPATAAAAEIINPICPVMQGKVNPDLFVEYKGKKVYFCCPGCIDEFNADPEKYIASLPQFATEAAAAVPTAADGPTEQDKVDISKLIVPVGVGVFVVLAMIAFTSSRKKPKS